MRALVIHNPASGPRTGDVFSFVRSALQPRDELVLRATASAGDIPGLCGDAADFDVVVASGGDGTVSRVAHAVRDANVPVLAFPSGTANLFANNLGCATEPAALAATLRDGRLATFDMGEIEYVTTAGERAREGFLTMAGAGFDANIMIDSQELKPMFGQLSYYLSAFNNPHPTYSGLTLTLDGERVDTHGICVLVGVWGMANPNFELIPGSSPQDGLLDVEILETSNATRLIPAVIGSLLGQGVNDPEIKVHHAREITLACDPELPMQFDGEVIENATTPFTIRVIPGGITTFVDALSPFYADARPLPWGQA